MDKINLLGKDLLELKEVCKSFDFPDFHGTQLFKWLYKKIECDFNNMSDIPNGLKRILEKKCIVKYLDTQHKFYSKEDDTIKFLLKTNDDKLIETVSMIDKGRHTVCISSQIGCSVDCDFCATAKMGIIRNLTSGEIIDQIIIVKMERKIPITNIVFMGMGEPFLNYKNVIKSCEILNNTEGFNLSSKKITISTSGILPKIKQFIAEKHKFKLAISLNASNNKVRDKLIPINKKWPIEKILASIKNYKYFKYRVIMFEYVLLEGINDSDKNAQELVQLLKGINCKINIIPYNTIDSEYIRSNKINNFVNILNKNKGNFRVFIRWSKGQDIDAACGQLATNNA